MPGNHEFLVRRNPPGRHPARPACDAARAAVVFPFIELDTEPRGSLADSLPDFGPAAADAVPNLLHTLKTETPALRLACAAAIARIIPQLRQDHPVQ